MKRKKRKINFRIPVIMLIGIIIISSLFLANRPHQQAIVTFPDGSKILAQIADSSIELETGLKDFAELPPGSGMIFIFEDPNLYGFWTKDMSFNIDIIWCNDDGEVIHMVEDIPPCIDDCEVIYPSEGAKFVVELNGGFISEHGISTGDTITYEIF